MDGERDLDGLELDLLVEPTNLLRHVETLPHLLGGDDRPTVLVHHIAAILPEDRPATLLIVRLAVVAGLRLEVRRAFRLVAVAVAGTAGTAVAGILHGGVVARRRVVHDAGPGEGQSRDEDEQELHGEVDDDLMPGG